MASQFFRAQDSDPLLDQSDADFNPPAAPLPILDLNSSGPLPKSYLYRAPRAKHVVGVESSDGIQIDSNSMLCHCPDCGAPMAVRVWLMLADCWSCGICIELTELQRRLVERRTLNPPALSATNDTPTLRDRAARTTGTVKGDERSGVASGIGYGSPPIQSPVKSAIPVKVATVLREPPRQLGRGIRASFVPDRRRSLGALLNDIPAWLVSLLLHLGLLTLLALFTMSEEASLDQILLSTAVSRDVREGGRVQVKPDVVPDYDLPVPEQDRPRDKREKQALVLADQEARQIRLDANADDPYLAPLEQIRHTIGSAKSQRTFAVRDPRVRVEMVKREGGTTLTEAAVARGLRWLSLHQSENGSWSLNRFSACKACRGRCQGRGSIVCDSAATSLSLLPFLGAGQTHWSGIYRDHVARGLRWLIEHQDENGDLRIDSQGTSGMYAHGQGAIVLCEAYAMTGDEMLREPAQRAIDFIVEAQHPAGGWRYRPGEPGDTSVLGWQVMALQSARVAGIQVPEETLELAGQYLDSVRGSDGFSYAYQRKRSPDHVMTAEAILCRMYTGWTFDDPGMREGVTDLVERFPPKRKQPNIYYWYYASQVMHHAGGMDWERWNRRLREILVQTQIKSGHEAGSWQPRGPHAQAGGRIYMTALAICTLEVYYRHAPIFRRLDLSVEADLE